MMDGGGAENGMSCRLRRALLSDGAVWGVRMAAGVYAG